jgi:DNA-binding HxlR family transcriptional regulator
MTHDAGQMPRPQEGASMTPRHNEGTESEAAATPRDCGAMRLVLDRVGDRWSLIIVTVLSAGPRRFNQLRRELQGVSQRMLTLTLRNLERDGLITRTVFPGVPAQVEYALSVLGRSFYDAVDGLMDWAERHRHEMDRAREAYQAKAVSAA